MIKLKVGDTVYLKNTYEEGVVVEVVSEKDYFIIWRTWERGIHNENDLLAFSEDELNISRNN